jgi:hypothetical protein
MTTPVVDGLLRAGIPLLAAKAVPEVGVECARMARLIRERRGPVEGRCRVVGFIPASDAVAVPAIAMQVGLALAEVGGSPVAIIDACGTWPAAHEGPANDPRITGPFRSTWLHENLALLTSRLFEGGATLPKLAAAIFEESPLFNHMLVDLTGFDRIGEHLSAIGLVDAVTVVARASLTRREHLEHWMRDIPKDRFLGVLLSGL